MSNNALVNKIINFSNVDGPGNRTAIFFQSCPFRCLYCHNPETINICMGCGKCVSACPQGALTYERGKVLWDSKACVNCDNCIKHCPNLSSPKVSLMEITDVLAVINRNKPFIRGITVSGGECMNYPEFLTELFGEVKHMGLTTFIDSNGFKDFEKFPELLAVTDKVMLDVKAFDNSFHRELTGQDNETVLKNLSYLLEKDKLYEVRTVLLNYHYEENLQTVTNVAKIINNRCRYKLIKYRQYGVRTEGLEKLGNFAYSDDEFKQMTTRAREIMENVVEV